MQMENYVTATDFCNSHRIEFSFVQYLQEYGLLSMTTIEKEYWIPCNQLQKLEQMVRMHYELNINIEGIDAIAHLLDRISLLQNEVKVLKNKLSRFDNSIL